MTNKPAKREKRPPRKISKTYLENAGLFYLERYASSADNFRRVMLRKIRRSCMYHKTEESEFIPLLNDLVERYKSAGLLNDEVFARGKVISLRRKGMGKQAIIAKLQAKGLSKDSVEEALDEVDENKEDAELDAALAYVKRKRLGKYRTKLLSDDPDKDKQRELASLARAGFGYDVAFKALEFDDKKEVLE